MRQHTPFSGLVAAVPQLIARVQCLHEWMPDAGFPAWTDVELQAMLSALAAVPTGLFMMKRVQTPFYVRNPYLFSDTTWGVMYVLHGLSGIGLVGLTIAHIYFAIRPEKLWITKGMVFGDITREDFLKHHDPQRWVVGKES